MCFESCVLGLEVVFCQLCFGVDPKTELTRLKKWSIYFPNLINTSVRAVT